jgi:hypothetical protein
MRLMVLGHVPAWCYVDTESGEVELVEVWAWDEEMTFEERHWVVAEDSSEDGKITNDLMDRALDLALNESEGAVWKASFDRRETRIEQKRLS